MVSGWGGAASAFGQCQGRGDPNFQELKPHSAKGGVHLLQLTVLLLDAFFSISIVLSISVLFFLFLYFCVCQWLFKERSIYLKYTPFSYFIPREQKSSFHSLCIVTFPACDYLPADF